MRDLLTGLAIVLIVALTAALVGPYLVDWNGQRAFLESRLTHALGQKVTIGGRIDLKLLPTPYLVLDQTVIGGDEGPIRIGVRRLNLELSITPLFHGEFDITEARLQEPNVRVALQPGHRLPPIGNAPAFDANLRFDRIVVNDGTIAISDGESGQNLVVNHLDLNAEAASLAGPFKGNGAAGPLDARTRFRFSTTLAQKRQTNGHLTIDENSSHPGVDLDGLLTFTQSDAKSIQPAFDGTVTLSGRLHDTDDDDFKWSLNGPLKINPQSASLDSGTLQLGRDDAAVFLDASGRLSFQTVPNFALALVAKQLNLDRLFPEATGNGSTGPSHVPTLKTIRELLPITQSAVDLDVSSATFRGEALRDIAAHLSFGSKGTKSFILKGNGPGGLRVTADGTSTADGEKTVGSFDVAADDISETMKWLSSVSANATIPTSALPFEKVSAKGTYGATASDVSADNLTLALDRSEVTGSARLLYGTKKAPDKLIADMKAKALDLDRLPSLGSLATASSDLDLQLSLDAKTVKVSQFGEGDLASGHLRFNLARTGQQIVLRDFRADDIGGATIVGDGKADATAADFSLTVDAARLDDVATALTRLAPGQFTDALKLRAPSLAPAKVKVAVSFERAPEGSFQPKSLAVHGKLASTNVDLTLSPEEEHSKTLVLKTKADAPQGQDLLRQLGLQTLPLDLLGPGNIVLDARGSADQPFQTSLDSSFGGTHFSAQGQLKPFGGSPGGAGTVTVKSADIAPLLQSLALAFPDLAGRIPVDIAGGMAIGGTGVAFSDLKGSIDGAPIHGGLKWEKGQKGQPNINGSFDLDHLNLSSVLGLALGPPQQSANDNGFSNAPFTTGLIDPPRTALKLRAKMLDLGRGFAATQASLDLQISPNVIEIKKLSADFKRGHASADLTIRRDGPQAAIEGTIAANNIDLTSPAARGRLTGHLDLAGSGKSPAALVSSLAGSGDATIKSLQVDGANPAALSHVFDAIERDEVAIDEDTVARAYSAAAIEPLSAGDRQFILGLASGTLHMTSADTPASGPLVSNEIEGTLDVNHLQFRTTTTETLESLPKNWSGSAPSISVVWSGALGGAARHVNVSNLINAAAARALARETARLEAYEFDIRERAFFNARLSSEHRREADQLKADDDARKAEVARLAAKKAAADKAAQDRSDQDRATQGPPSRPGSTPPGQSPDDPERRFRSAPNGSFADPSAAGRY